MAENRNNQSNQPTITKRRIASSKGLQLLCALLTLALDVVMLIMLFINTLEIKYLICPIVLLVLDLAFIVKVLFSNYRFKYAVIGVIIHVACIVVTCVGAILITEVLDDRIVFETFALIAMPGVHLLQCIAALCNAWQAAHRGKLVRRIVAIAMSALLLAGVGIYANFLRTNGFFGQGVAKIDRTVVYALDESGSHYIVTDVLDGKGNTVTVPAEFNGLPVKGIDCSLFANEELSYVVFNCGTELEFVNPGALSHVNEHLSLTADKSTIDQFRNTLYSLALENSEILYLANHITPTGLTEDEVYVIVRYDKDTLKLVEGQVLPTWFGAKEETFEVFNNDDYTKYTYVEHGDVTDNGDLYWCTVNQENQIFRWLYDEAGKDLLNTKIDESAEVSIAFDKIYQINFNDDNDDIYSIDSIYTSIQVDGGLQSYKLATADRVDDIFEAVPGRDGFDLTWYIGNDRRPLLNLEAELKQLDEHDINRLEAHPEWDLRAPVIDLLSADGKTEGHSAIYGNDVELKSMATPPHETISLKYEWSFENVLSETQDYTIHNIHPQHKGTYKLKVTAYADFTSLTKSVEKTIDVGFEKRELHFEWLLPSDTVYAAENKSIAVKEKDAINEDDISVRLSQDSVRNAGEYTISIELYGDTDEKYKIATEDVTRTLTIVPYEIDVKWGSIRTFEYNGELHAPEASVMGLKNDGALEIAVSGKQKNAGANYTATASTTNMNYRLRGTEMTYEITRRPINSIVWNSTKEFVYNASEQKRTISSLGNCIAADKESVLNTMIYEGAETNVGDYIITAKLPENSNYEFQCQTSTDFRITPRNLKISLADKVTVYNGLTYSGFSFVTTGLQGKDKAEEVFELEYTGEATTAINVRDNAYIVDATPIAKAKYNNYTITIEKGSLTIQKKTLKVTINNETKTYDGLLFPVSNFGFTHDGLATTDTIEEVLSLNYSGTALTEKKAGAWNITATATHGEKYNNYSVQITPAKLTINKAPLTVTAVGGKKEYDGTVFTGFSYTASGLVNNESQASLGSPSYSGAATSNKNAGTHVLNVKLPSNSVSANYDITYVAGSVVIDKKPLTVTAIGGSKTYDGKAGNTGFSFTANGLISGETSKQLGNPTYGGAATTNKNVGTHVLTIQLPANAVSNNYDITYVNGEFTINKKNVSVTVTANNKVYNGEETYTFNYNVSGLVSGESREVLGEPVFGGSGYGAMDVGNYVVTISLPGNDNYNITSYTEGSLTITRAPLKISASAKDRVYDGSVGGEFTFVTDGFMGNDGVDLLGQPTYSGSALTAKNAGNYTLKVSFSETLKNYTVSYTDDTFTIQKAQLTVTPGNMEKTYDGTGFDSKGFDFEVTGLVNNETKAMLGAPTWSGEATTKKTAGAFQLKVSLPNNSVTSNYQITYNTATCTIMKAALTVTVHGQEKTYDGKRFDSFEYSVSGLVNGETKAMLGTPTWGGSAYTQTGAGTHELTITLPKNTVTSNYEITYNPATCIINKKALTVNPVGQEKTYDGATFSGFDFEVTGLASGDTKAELGTPTWGGEAATQKNVGSYELTMSLPNNAVTSNYEITYGKATCVINKKALTVTAVATDRDYESGVVGGTFDFTVEGLASGDSKSDFNVTYGGSAATATNAGTYTLTVAFEETGKALNYDITYVSDTGFEIREVVTETTAQAE